MYSRVMGAKLALFLGDDLVTLQRDDRPGLLWAGYWDLPGGGREGAETPLQCVLRETREELSLRLDPGLVTWGRAYGASNGKIAWFFAAWAPADLAGQVALGDEGQGWKLIPPTAFLQDEAVVPNFKPRLQDVLAGVESAEIDRSNL